MLGAVFLLWFKPVVRIKKEDLLILTDNARKIFISIFV